MMQNSEYKENSAIPKRVILMIFDANQMIFTLSGNVFTSK